MKNVLMIIMTTLFTLNSLASLDAFCESKKGNTGHYKNGDNYYIYKGPNLYKFEDGFTRLIFSKYEVRSVKEHKDRLYILTPMNVFVRDLKDFSYVTSFPTTNSQVSKKHQTAQDMTIIGDSAYIAHGSLGLIKINLESFSIDTVHQFTLPHDPGQISTATGIASDGNRIFTMLDNVTYNYSRDQELP